MKVSGAVKNLVQGVSTQSPKERLEGQVWAMSNFIPDPVEGAVKRPGVKHVASVYGDLPSATTGLAATFRTVSVALAEYAVGTYDGRIVARSLETGLALTVYQEASTYGYFLNGIQCTTNIGEYTLLAGDAVVTATQQQLSGIYSTAYTSNGYTATAAVNRAVVFEVRQGAYSGTYSIARTDGTVLATYTVPDGSVGSHSVNVQPAYITGQLYTGMTALIGTTIGTGTLMGVQQQGASIALFINYPSALDEAAALYASDGFYNTRMVMTDKLTASPSTLPGVGIEGHVVEVGKDNSRLGNYYLRFQHTGTTGALSLGTNKLRPGRWVECGRSYAAVGYTEGGVLTASTLPRLMYILGSNVYIGSGTYVAAQVLAVAGQTITPLAWGNREAGDADSSPDPMFVGSSIKWMGVFQDRLVLMGDAAVCMSRTSDYLNLYRASVIDDLATDPINLSSTFDTSDRLVGAALLDKNLVVLGTKTHYAVPGRAAVTPTTATLLKTSAFESSPSVPPVSFGNMVYFSSSSQNNSDILAIQPSDTQDSTYAYPVSSHVDGFIPGGLTTLVASTKTNILFALASTGVLYGYRTLFNQGDRVLSAWFDFTFPTDLKLATLSIVGTKLKLLFHKVVGTKLITTVGELDLDRVGYTGANRHRYLDFWSETSHASYPYADTSAMARAVYSKEAPVAIDSISGLGVGVGSTADTQASATYTETFDGLVANRIYTFGVPYVAKFSPTMPVARTSDGKVTSIGRLAVGQMKVNYAIGAQFNVTVTDKYRTGEYWHSARRVGAVGNLADAAYIVSGFHQFPVGSSEDDARVSLISTDHYPLVLSSIDWMGQFFKRGTVM